MTYRNQCRLRRYRRQLKRQRDILASLTPWQRELIEAILGGSRVSVAYSRANGMHYVLSRAQQLHANGYTPSVEWRDEV